ncbi:hypothetical protein DSO57_1037677 [Entomophthora muscae]|uniref:Uncharacterized protein n=1 Tax=Entomophthora muscae TaxID=34485 RepID=A0ACC2TWT6_9FUNG|nr:hypothetical protein DSO57_1037677 [Entomophthora muscae]
MVIDEADTMFEKGFGDDVKSLIATMVKSCKNQKRDYQLAVVSATLPKLVLQTLESRFPDLVRITTPSLHKALPKCKQYFVDLKDYKGNRTLGLLDVLRQFEQRSTASPKKKESDRILIFCNTRKSVTIVQAFLRERKIDCLSLYGGIPCTHQPPASPEQIHAFLYPSSDRVSANYDFSIPARVTTRSKVPVPVVEASEGEELAAETHPLESTSLPKILICTDIASRGLDTTSVNHVIMYDFPVAALDYLHRCGRTARAGQSGVVTSLLGKKDRTLAERIRRSIRTNTVLS